jgi:hypothetical protein
MLETLQTQQNERKLQTKMMQPDRKTFQEIRHQTDPKA